MSLPYFHFTLCFFVFLIISVQEHDLIIKRGDMLFKCIIIIIIIMSRFHMQQQTKHSLK